MIKTVLIEDNELIRENWAFYFKDHSKINYLGSFANIQEAINSNILSEVNVLVLDLNLSGENSKDYIQTLLLQYPNLKIMIFSVSENHRDIFESLENGAVTYLTKNTNPIKLVESIEETHYGGSVISPEIAKILVQSFQKNNKLRTILSELEEKILFHLANGKSYKEIAKEICLSNHGIDYHIRKIYEKLHVKTRNQAVHVALKENLLSKFF